MEYLHAKNELSRKSLKEINSLVKKHKFDINLPIYDILWMLVLKQSANMPGRQIEHEYQGVAQLSDACMGIIEDIVKKLGKGVTDFPVYQVCLKDNDCRYAAKFLGILSSNPQEEVYMTKEASNLGIGPKFIDSWTCEIPGFDNMEVTVLITEMLDITLDDYLRKNKNIPQIKRHLYDLYRKMLKERFYHIDLKAENIVLKLDTQENVIDALAIDFDNAKILSTPVNPDILIGSVRHEYGDLFPELVNGTWINY